MTKNTYDTIKSKCDLMTEDEINALANEKLWENQFFESYLLFYFNCKKYKTVRAYHNMGCYYYEFGRYTTSGKECGVDSAKAIRCLKKACAMQENYMTFCELGFLYCENIRYSRLCRISMFYKKRQYAKARKYFERSLKYSSTAYNNHMYACTLFVAGQYRAAQQYFWKAYQICSAANDRDDALANYGVCSAIIGEPDIEWIVEYFTKQHQEDPGANNLFPMLSFMFFYRKEYQRVMQNYELVKDEFAMEDDLFQIYLYSYYKLYPEKIDPFFQELLELTDADSSPANMRHYRKFLAKVKRDKMPKNLYTQPDAYENHFIP